MATLSRTERRVFLWRVSARAKPSEAAEKGKSATLEEIIGLLEAAQTGGNARVHLTEGNRIWNSDEDGELNPKNQLYIAQIKRNQTSNTVTLLFVRGDPNAVSPAFVNMADSAVRVANPGPKEAVGWSAHLVISTRATSTYHRACFEQVPGLSTSLVMATIDRILERSLAGNPSYRYDVIKSVRNKPQVVWKSYRPSLEVARVPSENLVDDLERGELAGITLTQATSEYAGPGLSRYITRQERKIVLHTARAGKSELLRLVKDVMSFAKQHRYETITFDLAKLPGNMTNHPTLQVADEQALEHLYVRAQLLTGFVTILEQCYGTISDDIEKKMIQLLSTEADW